MKNERDLKFVHNMYKNDKEVYDELKGIFILIGLGLEFTFGFWIIHIGTSDVFKNNFGTIGSILKFIYMIFLYICLMFSFGLMMTQEVAFCGRKMTKVYKILVKFFFNKNIYATDVGNDIYTAYNNEYKVISCYSVHKYSEDAYVGLNEKYSEPRYTYTLSIGRGNYTDKKNEIPITKEMFYNLSAAHSDGAEMIISCEELVALYEVRDNALAKS